MRTNKSSSLSAQRTLCAAAVAAALVVVAESRTTTPSVSTTTTIRQQQQQHLFVVRGGASADASSAAPNQKKKSKRKKKKINDKQQQQQQDGSDDQPFTRGNTGSDESAASTTASSSNRSNQESPRTTTSSESSSASSLPKHEKEPTNPTKTTTTPAPPAVVQEILKHDDYYAILGITKQSVATSSSKAAIIQKAYRKRAVQTHPDKTAGDRRAFDKVTEAFHVLKDEQKRRVYDRLGKRGLEQLKQNGASAATSPEDLFRSFFASGGNPFFAQQPQQQSSRNRTCRYQLQVTLEDLYNGSTRTVLVAPPAEHRFNRQQQQPQKQVDVHIQRGALDGQSIVLSGEMDFDESAAPGDLIFVLHQHRHDTFTRRGHDLALGMTVSFKEALCGVHRTIQHLDGRLIHVASAQSSAKNDNNHHDDNCPMLIQTGDVQVLKGQGMPKNAAGTEFGDLYIQFEVTMPFSSRQQQGSTLTRSERHELARLLDKLEGKRSSSSSFFEDTNSKAAAGHAIHVLQPAVVEDFGVASGTPQMPRDPTSAAEEEHDHDEMFASPFGHGRFYFSGGSPFFGHGTAPQQQQDHDDGNVQCRQM